MAEDFPRRRGSASTGASRFGRGERRASLLQLRSTRGKHHRAVGLCDLRGTWRRASATSDAAACRAMGASGRPCSLTVRRVARDHRDPAGRSDGARATAPTEARVARRSGCRRGGSESACSRRGSGGRRRPRPPPRRARVVPPAPRSRTHSARSPSTRSPLRQGPPPPDGVASPPRPRGSPGPLRPERQPGGSTRLARPRRPWPGKPDRCGPRYLGGRSPASSSRTARGSKRGRASARLRDP
jgi:hypothetical protein